MTAARLRPAGWFAVAMAALGVVADLLLQYTPDQAHLHAYAWGSVFHASALFVGLLAHAGELGSPVAHPDALQAAFRSGQVGLLAGSALMLVAASACYAWAVAAGRSAYPRWAVALTPLPLYAVLGVPGFVPVVDLLFAPIAFSGMSLVFFLGSTLLLGPALP